MLKSIIVNLKENWITYGFETIVVVVGVLVAFSLTNWSEDRKAMKVEEELLVDLHEDLIRNKELLLDDLKGNLRSIRSIDIVLSVLNNKSPYSDTLNAHFHAARVWGSFTLSNSSYEEIRNKGFEMIKSNTLRKSIIDLFEVSFSEMQGTTARVQSQAANAVFEYLLDNFENVEGGLKPNRYNSLLTDQKYVNILAFQRNIKRWHGRQLEELIEELDKVLLLLEDELRQK